MLVQIKDLSKQYKEQKGVTRVSFTIERGKCIALLGPNGAGKTTTLLMLAGLLTPSSGSIVFTGYENKDYRKLIGFLPQHPSFFNWMTAKEFLFFAGKLSEVPKQRLAKRVEETLAFVSLEDAKNKKIGGFSGGMKQRLGLAQALLHEPELLILDEPVSALDPAGRRDVLQLIEKLKTDMTILFSTHILHDAEQVCDEILMVKGGHLRWNGTLEALRKEFTSLAIKLRTEQAIKQTLDQIDFIESIDYLDQTSAVVYLKDLSQSNELLATLISKDVTVVHYEMMQDSLEDAYMKVMEQ
ncbi:ATP-binding cassette domain-containing protein [Halalkalibacter kiskunsagensis]|uniref:ATP-binding cassette domain-containing protein n=1 Tax=Halalkalibacter kiskunsagensis TaxID=1548599 RepID=A0ABV6K9G3_9BACI